MVDVAAAVAAVVDQLIAAGVRATCDERLVNPPAVYVAPPRLTYRFRHGDATAEWTAWAAVPNSGRATALTALTALLAAATEALGMVAVTAAPADLTVPELAAPLPAYQLTWTTRLRQDTPLART